MVMNNDDEPCYRLLSTSSTKHGSNRESLNKPSLEEDKNEIVEDKDWGYSQDKTR